MIFSLIRGILTTICGDYMISKKEKSKLFLQNNFNFVCPICNDELTMQNDTMICSQNHNFDISKKGVICLLNTGKLKTNYIYDKNLFAHRRSFINNGFYSKLCDNIIHILNNYGKRKINIVDLGCGEGIIDNNILESMNDDYCFLGIDYNKDAINLALDYLKENAGFIVSDVNNLPIANNSVDLVLNILSPYYSEEIKRVLKNDGLFIKVIPDKKYLIELRNILGFDDYEKTDLLISKLKNNFEIIQEINIDENYKITQEQIKDLQAMTPLVKSKKLKDKDNKEIDINSITINLKILVMRRK